MKNEDKTYEMIVKGCFIEEKGVYTSLRCVFNLVSQFLAVHQDFLELFDCEKTEDENGNERIKMKPTYLKKNLDFIKFLSRSRRLRILDTGLYLSGFRPICCGKIAPMFSRKNVVGRRTVYGSDGKLKIDEDIYGITTWKR